MVGKVCPTTALDDDALREITGRHVGWETKINKSSGVTSVLHFESS